MRQMARNLTHNTELNEDNRDGAFRHGLAYWRGKFNTSGRNIRTKYSEAVHFVDHEEGPYIKDADGKLYNPKLIKPVPPESKSVRIPRWLQETWQANRDETRSGRGHGASVVGCRTI